MNNNKHYNQGWHNGNIRFYRTGSKRLRRHRQQPRTLHLLIQILLQVDSLLLGQDPMQTQAAALATQGVGSYQPYLQAAQTAQGHKGPGLWDNAAHS